MDTTEHEGQKLKRLVEERGHKIADLARAANKSWPAAKKWVAAETIGPEARESVVTGLRALGIDPRLMWMPDQGETLDEMKTLLTGIDQEVLKRIRKLLLANRANQQRLVDYIDGRLEQ
jgi:hypothetical protein